MPAKKKSAPANPVLEKILKEHNANKTYEEHSAFPLKILREHGAEGYGLYENVGLAKGVVQRFFELADLPASSPFKAVRGKKPKDAIQKIFAPLQKRIPRFVAALKAKCQVIIALERKGDKPTKNGWFLLYFLDCGPKTPPGRARFKMLAGRAPEKTPKLNKKATAKKFKVPAPLRTFYKVHNGLGVSTHSTEGSGSIQSADALEPLKADLELLEFHFDSGGNRKLFARAGDTVFDWDRETHRFARMGTLWNFIEGEMLSYISGKP